MNTKKITASVVGVMLLATVLAMAVSAASMDRSKYADMPRMVYEYDAADDTGLYINENLAVPSDVTVRIYGEEDAIYPTQSYTGANNFIYPDPVDAFDPGVIGKDSATFNPAYLDDEYGLASAWWTDNIIVDGENGDEKVFLRVFYEPGYAHAADAVMSDYYSLTDVSMELGALVTETTYMLLENNIYDPEHSGRPKAGGIVGTERTRFMLPVAPSSVMDTTPGMNRGDMVDLAYAAHGSMITEGTIEVEESYDSTTTSIHLDDNVSFMDHSLILSGFNSAGAPIFTINYIGNMYAEHAEQRSHTLVKGEKFYFDRGNSKQATSNPAYRWYLEVTEVSYNQFANSSDNYVHISVGRRLAAGETFYVDGVRYDMPAIYVTDDDKFKYITLQSPIPKCDEGLWGPHNRPDTSHVRSQWLANLDEELVVWVLPPFNAKHTMIDDIGIPKDRCEGSRVKKTIDSEAGNILPIDVSALEFYYVVEDTEDRFDTSLAERHARKDGVELWNWWSVFTKPYEYTELYLPNQEIPTTKADGYEYLITTSFIAPNSEAEERTELCKSDREVHDLFDRAATIANAGDNSRDAYANMPRMVFEYDAYNDEDLFVNSAMVNAVDCEVPTVRVYGEADAIYPTQSFTGADNFIYPNHVDAFDPGVIAKDSVTFNPAYLDDEYGLASAWWTDNIIVDGENGDEKVFLRVFYEPGYAHAADAVMSGYYSLTGVSMELGALVTETTYMLLENNLYGEEHSGLPKAGGIAGTERTRFMLPVASSDVLDTTPGMDRGDMVDLAYAAHGSMITAGTIEVEESYDSVTSAVHLDDDVSFMDHSLIMGGFNSAGAPMFTIGYVGNMNAEHAEQMSHTIAKGEKFYFDRGNSKSATSNPAYRWYLEVTEVSYNPYTPAANYAHITVGRRLAAGETFYVDGVRYDMPAIYVTDDDKFKYITLQSPIPKCDEGLWDPHNRPDTSHVRSQWLANLLTGKTVWVLPPFNGAHTMIDDIGIPKVSCGGVTRTIVSEAGNILDIVPALEFCYVDEAEEGRFDTSLAERHAYDGSVEIWNWWSIFTKPYQYTELYLPNQETAGDGYEYLITTSFIAPNCEVDERAELCKSDREVHDIIDRASEIDGIVTQTDYNDFDTNCDCTIDFDEVMGAVQAYFQSGGTDPDFDEVMGNTALLQQPLLPAMRRELNLPPSFLWR